MRNPYLPVIDLIVVGIFVFAFVVAEPKHRITLLTIMALLFIFPSLFRGSAVGWVCLAGRVIFGVACYIYIKWHGIFR